MISDIRAAYLASLGDAQKTKLLRQCKRELPASVASKVKALTSNLLAEQINHLIPDFQRQLDKRLSATAATELESE